MKSYQKLVNSTVCVAIIGVAFISSGIILISLRSWFLNTIINKFFVFTPNSGLSDNWKISSDFLYTNFYFFNWTNYEDIFDKSKKPTFQEIGPFRFKERREMVNLTWNDNSTITYSQLRYWYFDETKSKGKLTDRITTLNPILMSAANQYNNWNSFMKKEFLLAMATAESHLHVTKTVAELLFDGYEDPYVDVVQKLPLLVDTLPTKEKFGWFYRRNGSYTHDGVFNMATGADGNMGKLLQFNYGKHLPFHSSECTEVYGSYSGLFPQHIAQESRVIYYPEVCRHIKLDYERDVISNNFAGYKYIAQQSLMENGLVVQENKCYCDGECPPFGIFNISSCKFGIPAFASLPHFYEADPIYLTKIDGLRPEKSQHEMYITLEPKTGTILSSALRIQFNIHLHPVENITLFKQVPRVFMPVLWYERKEHISSELVSTLKIMFKVPVVCTIIAIVEMFIGIYFLYVARKRHRLGPFYSKSTCRKNIRFEEVPLHNDMDGPYCSTTVDAADYLEVLNDDSDEEEVLTRK